MKSRFLSLLAVATAASLLAACSGGSTPSISAPTPGPAAPNLGFVGVGDSLTAGYQSAGWFGGAPGSVANPLATGLPVAALGVPPGQESGFWSQIWMQMNGASQLQYVQISSPSSSVLPLVGGPGLGNQIVPANPAVTHGPPFGTLPTRSGCDSFNQAAYSAGAVASTVRQNPTTMAHDVAIPGITLHEVIQMNQPPSPSCVPIAGAPPVIQGLQQLLSESGAYYPALVGFPSVPGQTELNAALSLRPTLATVWLGANDVLHYAFSGGTFTAVDGVFGNTSQVQQDMTTVITSLQKAGANVVVANLPDVLETPFFMSVAPLPSQAQCATLGAVQTFLACVLAQGGVPYAVADGIRAQVAAAYGLNPGAGGNAAINGGYGYVTLGGTVTILTALGAGKQPNLDPNGPGTGLGSEYTTPALAANIQTLNTTLNTGIGAAATATGAPLVDIHTTFTDIATGCAGGCANDPLAQVALGGINPPLCCSLTFGGGLVSFDGLHPSNTGYALVAEQFIQVINAKYKAGIPDLNLKAQHDGTGTIPFHDPYAQ